MTLRTPPPGGGQNRSDTRDEQNTPLQRQQLQPQIGPNPYTYAVTTLTTATTTTTTSSLSTICCTSTAVSLTTTSILPNAFAQNFTPNRTPSPKRDHVITTETEKGPQQQKTGQNYWLLAGKPRKPILHSGYE